MTENELVNELAENDRDILIRMFKSRLNLTDANLNRVEDDFGKDISIEAGSGKVNGYGGFVASFQFDKNGMLIGAGIWE